MTGLAIAAAAGVAIASMARRSNDRPRGQLASNAESLPESLPRALPEAVSVVMSPSATAVLTRGGRAHRLSSARTLEITSGTLTVETTSDLVSVRAPRGNFTVSAMQAKFAVAVHDLQPRVEVFTGLVWVQPDSARVQAVVAPGTWTAGSGSAAGSPPASDVGQASGRTRPAPSQLVARRPGASAAAAHPPRSATNRREETSSMAVTPPGTASEPARPVEPAPTIDLYARAEAALAHGDLAGARTALEELLATQPADSRANLARLDLARIAQRAGDVATTRAYASVVASTAEEPALREAGQHLLCRIAVSADPDEARACARSYRRLFPDSSRQAEMMALEASLTIDDCAARPLLVEYLSRFAGGPYADDAGRRLAECPAPR